MYKIDPEIIAKDIAINNNNNQSKLYKFLLKFNLKHLGYLLQDDPKKVMSKSGVKIRKLISPGVRKLVPFFVKTKTVMVREEELPKNKRIIFVATHGLKDDIAQTIKIAGKHAYVLFASLPSFFSTINGIVLWLNGVLLFNRKKTANNTSSKSAVPKMEQAIEYGADVIVFSEGTWNKSPNKAVLKLYKGAQRVAVNKQAVIVPIATVQEGENMYYIRDKAFDITEFDSIEGLKVIRDKLATLKYEIMAKYSCMKREEFGNRQETDEYFANYLKELVDSADGFYDHEIEDSSELRDETFAEVLPVTINEVPLQFEKPLEYVKQIQTPKH